MLEVNRIKSLVLGIAVLVFGAYFWWSGGFSPSPAVVGVYNVVSGQPVIGIAVVLVDAQQGPRRLGFTDRKGQLVVEGVSHADLRQVTVQSNDYVVTTEDGNAQPALAVEFPIFVRIAPKPLP